MEMVFSNIEFLITTLRYITEINGVYNRKATAPVLPVLEAQFASGRDLLKHNILRVCKFSCVL